jgi:hypothetical protein
MIKPEWHFMRNLKGICSCINKYEECCGKKENTSTSTTSGDIDITYNYNNDEDKIQ